MPIFPLRVKRRDNRGAVAEVLCDTAAGAQSNAKQFRDLGYIDVWIEEVDGRRIDEKTLNALRPQRREAPVR